MVINTQPGLQESMVITSYGVFEIYHIIYFQKFEMFYTNMLSKFFLTAQQAKFQLCSTESHQNINIKSKKMSYYQKIELRFEDLFLVDIFCMKE